MQCHSPAKDLIIIQFLNAFSTISLFLSLTTSDDFRRTTSTAKCQTAPPPRRRSCAALKSITRPLAWIPRWCSAIARPQRTPPTNSLRCCSGRRSLEKQQVGKRVISGNVTQFFLFSFVRKNDWIRT